MPAKQLIDVPDGQVSSEVTGEGSGRTPLLCLHGGPGVPSPYLESLRGLSDERPVVLYDQLGCGRSSTPASTHAYHADRFVEEVGVVRSALALEEIHLLGHSWGGMLALMYALTQPDGLVSLTLASPVIDVSRWVADCNALKGDLPEDVRNTLDQHEARGYTACLEYAAANLEWWRRHVCRMRPFPDALERSLSGFGTECYETMWGPSEFTCTGNLRSVKLSPRLGEIGVRTLFTCGRYDEATPASTEAFASLVPGARVAVFDESSHMPHLEQEQEYVSRIGEFLRYADEVAVGH